MDEKCSPDQNQKIKPVDISEEFIYSLVCNFKEVPSGRGYSVYIYDLSNILFLHSQIIYKILRSIIPLPSEQMLYKEYGT